MKKLNVFTTRSQTEEEGREAEATQAPSINTRSRGGSRGVSPMYQRRGRRGRPQPIVWQEGKSPHVHLELTDSHS